MSIQKQWDPAVSAFNTLDRITSLVKAGTVDDVQPQAVIAAEHLGSLMIVHPQRIGQAIDALGGSNSFRLENVKLSLGLSSGGIAAQIRKSTPAIRCFLFAACLSLHLTPNEIGSFLYEMMEKAGLLETVPVSPAQLASFVNTLEGHMKELLRREQVATTSLAPLLEILSNQASSSSKHFEPLSPKLSSPIFLETFQAIRSEEVSSAELSGCTSAVWIASILSWLCPSDVSITAKDQENGVNKTRICLSDREWQLKKWYRIADVTTVIFEEDSRKSTSLSATRCVAYNYWLSAGFSLNEITIIGHIVRELLRASFETAMIRTRDHQYASEHRPMPFRRCCSPIWVKDLANLHQSFGWPAASVGDPEEFERQAKEIRELIQAHAATSDKSSLQYVHNYPLWEELTKWLSRQPNYNRDVFFEEELSEKTCVNVALRVADSLFVEACCIDRSERRLRPFSLNVRNEDRLESLVLHVVSTGVMYVDDFVIRSLAAIDPDVMSSPEGRKNRWPLVVVGQGLVAYPSMLNTFSLSPNEAMAVVVQPGSLRWRETQYTRIIEPIQGNNLHKYSDELKLYDSNGFPLASTGVGEKALCSLNLSISYERDELLLSTEVVAKNAVDGSTLFRANRFFHRAIWNITTAHVAEALDASPEVLAAEVRGLPSYYRILLVEINDSRLNNFRAKTRGSAYPENVEHNFRGVLTYTGSPSVNCLLAGPRNISFPLVIQRSASLLECVVQAHKVWRREKDGRAEYLILPTRSN